MAVECTALSTASECELYCVQCLHTLAECAFSICTQATNTTVDLVVPALLVLGEVGGTNSVHKLETDSVYYSMSAED